MLAGKKIQAVTVLNTIVSLSAFAWTTLYFDSVREKQPAFGEIDLDPCTWGIFLAEDYFDAIGVYANYRQCEAAGALSPTLVS